MDDLLRCSLITAPCRACSERLTSVLLMAGLRRSSALICDEKASNLSGHLKVWLIPLFDFLTDVLWLLLRR